MTKQNLIRYASALLFTVALASCNREDTDLPGSGNGCGEISFGIGFAPQTRVATAPDFTSTWENGDAIGIFAVAHGQLLSANATGNHIHNAKLIYSSANGGEWTQETPLYWPTTADGITSLDFYAYHPYDPTASDPTAITFNVQTDQSGTTTIGGTARPNYNLSDLLTAKSTGAGNGTGGWSKGETVRLQFSHALAMVEVTLDNSAGAIDHREELKVTLRGVQPGAQLNLGVVDAASPGAEISLAATGNDPTAITMYRVEQQGTPEYTRTYTFRALVPAQTLVQDTRAAFITNGQMMLQSSALTAAVPLATGQAERFTQTLPHYTHTVLIPAGSFLMGESGWPEAEPVHKVTLTQYFRMSKYQVTNAQYVVFLNENDIRRDGQGTVTYYNSDFSTPVTTKQTFVSPYMRWNIEWDTETEKWFAHTGYENNPVICVSWYGAKAYADWIGSALPTEAQWEYACRSGTQTAYYFGSNEVDLGNYGWHLGNTDNDGTRPVGMKIPNAFGLYDMHGNVFEWCADWYGDYDSGDSTDPLGPPTRPSNGSYRVVRGGSWITDAQYHRSAFRSKIMATTAVNHGCGFRVVFIP